MTWGRLFVVLADQLTRTAVLRDLDPATDLVFMCEVEGETDYVPQHPRKIAFLFSAMRHFAADLRKDGIGVDYVTLDDPANTQSLAGEVRRAVKRHAPDRAVVTEPGEWRVLKDVERWQEACGIPVEIREDTRFLCSRSAFSAWAQGRSQLRMELFYRRMREATGYLMGKDGKPEGGQWNFDTDNRKTAAAAARAAPFARPMRFPTDEITEEVIALVDRRFGDRFGSTEGFWFAVTQQDARLALAHFIRTALPGFGDFQDAMLEGEDWLFHSALSQYINCGLLAPREVCEAVLEAYEAGQAPLNSVEGYIRQIIGWREYVRGIYWHSMPDYARENRLGAQRPLPSLYWTGETPMNCMAQVIDLTRREAHSHHIQRLMITGNFALLAGIRPEAICAWYLAVYADAYEWVELPNVLGMVMHADGGYLGSKPYAAGGNYISRMSNFCKGCAFDVKKKSGKDACPFNYLYWNFIIEHRERFETNPRMAPIYRTMAKMPQERLDTYRDEARAFLKSLDAA